MTDNNKHHLFSRREIRAKLIEILGDPKSDADLNYLKNEINWAHKLIPRYKISKESHRLIHIKEDLRNQKPSEDLIEMRKSSKVKEKSFEERELELHKDLDEELSSLGHILTGCECSRCVQEASHE